VQNSSIFQRVKGFFITAKEPETEVLKKGVAASAIVRAGLLADPEVASKGITGGFGIG
jgi:hypothetical protein